jgi:CubicO group peptidase (beta-lactamase class C family)
VRPDLDATLRDAPEAAEVPGFVAAARFSDGQTETVTGGRRSIAGEAPMTADTVFWIASFTKLVTSIAALQLVDEGRLSLDQTVASILPDFADLPILEGFDADGAAVLRPASDAPTIRHLLTHTSGLGYTFMDADLGRYADQQGIGPDAARRLPRRFTAGERWHYGVSTDWVGAVVEAIEGETLDRVVARRITGPLGMTDTSFAPSEAQMARGAAVHARLPDGGLVPIPFAMPREPNFSMGGGGLYSTARDYLSLLTAILEGRILSDGARAELLANQIGDMDAGVMVSSNPALTLDYEPMPGYPKRWGLGLLLNPAPGPDGRSAGSGAWAGLANCYYWLDPDRRVAGVFLTQILPFGDPAALALFSCFERAVYA